MPSPERNQYSNKESSKVNAGLAFGLANSSNAPQAIINFGTLPFSCVVPEPKPSLRSLVNTLCHPPAHAFVHGTLSIQWVLGAVGMRQFVFREADERYVLKPDSRLRLSGLRLGLPGVYIEWLCGDEEGVTATEQGMVLTREFFEGERQ
ncbi:hypothetical protein BDW02DRAFT_492836 [Decorospora gaudefroyi]|uniref:Uncharacterized protein n=1 Tax=Decorospora gaudefroyi TaxID=184978 RepID=A0A6A5KF17_9PLEO|nr:hypothetical protein BDW02DRAFT_492836 [Decorospora gaudefroyi]